MGSNTQLRAWLAAAVTCLIFFGAVYVPPANAVGYLAILNRAVPLLYKFVKYSKKIDYWKLFSNTVAFLSTAYDVVNLYRHLTEVETTIHTHEAFHEHLRTCKVCNELFCAMTSGTEAQGQIPPFSPRPQPAPQTVRSGSTRILTTEPKAFFDHVWTDHNVLEAGRKGLRIHLRFRIEDAQEVSCRAVAYFSRASGEPLRDRDGTYFTARGQVSVGKDFRPAYPAALYRDMALFIPYDELHMPPGRHDLSFQVALYDKVAGRFLDRSTGYDFTIRK